MKTPLHENCTDLLICVIAGLYGRKVKMQAGIAQLVK